MGISRGKQGIRSGMAVSKSRQELCRSKVCMRVLFLALFFGSQLLTECEPLTVSNKTFAIMNSQLESFKNETEIIFDLTDTGTDTLLESNEIGGTPENLDQVSRLKRSVGKKGSREKAYNKFLQDVLDAHNEYRAKHRVPPLKLNKQLSRLSQQWAEHLAREGGQNLHHRPFMGYGENIYGSGSFNIKNRAPVDAWYDEIRFYKFGDAVFSKKIGHFTQVIWKSSKELGVGIAKTSRQFIVVCNYSPPGNYPGQFRKNVPPVGGWRNEIHDNARSLSDAVWRSNAIVL